MRYLKMRGEVERAMRYLKMRGDEETRRGR
jgi:hypothetical protein